MAAVRHLVHLGLLAVMDLNVCMAWKACPTSCTASALLDEVCRVRRVTGAPVSVPPYVLRAHWGDGLGYDVLLTLSTRYRIVPVELLDFLQATVALGRCIHGFLHPCSLFTQPATATWVYGTLAGQPLTHGLVDTLCYLSSSRHSNAYAPSLEPMIVSGLAGCAEGLFDDAVTRKLCRLGFRHVSGPALDPTVVGKLAWREATSTAALTLVGRLSFDQRASIAGALAWVARCGSARAMQFLQSLSTDEVYAARVANACCRYTYAAYIDRLGVVTLWHMVGHMVVHAKSARVGLVRLAVSSGSRAVHSGVFTALIANSSGAVVPNWPPAADPGTAHETVHYVHATGALPPNPYTIDEAMKCARCCVALKMTSRRCRVLRLAMLRAVKWRRRRPALQALLRGQCPIMSSLRSRPFTWRLVFAYI